MSLCGKHGNQMREVRNRVKRRKKRKKFFKKSN